MASTCPLIFNSFSPFTNPLGTVLSAPITIGIIVTFMFHSVFCTLARSSYLSLFSFSFDFTLWSAGTAKTTIRQVPFLFFSFSFFFFFFFLLTVTRSGRLAEIRCSVYVSKSKRTLYISFSRPDSGLCIYHLFVLSNSDFLHNSQWITLPTQSYYYYYHYYYYYYWNHITLCKQMTIIT